MVKITQRIKVGQRFLTFQEWRYVIVMIHSILVIVQTIFVTFINDDSLNYNISLVFLSLLGVILLLLNFPVVNVLYSFGVLYVIAFNYQDIWMQWKLVYQRQDEKCSKVPSECIVGIIEYSFSVVNVLTMFYYIVPIFLAVMTYSSTLNKISPIKSQMRKKVHFIRQTGESYPVEEMLNILYDEKNYEHERNAFNIITSKNFQNIIVGQHLATTKEPVSISNYENTKGTRICYTNNYVTEEKACEAKQIFLYTSSGIHWIPGTP